jgi:hypothetical protein
MYIDEEFKEGTLVVYDYKRAEKHWNDVIENNEQTISRWLKPRPKKLESFKGRVLKVQKTDYEYHYDELYKVVEFVYISSYQKPSDKEIRRRLEGFVDEKKLENAIAERGIIPRSFPLKVYHCVYTGKKGSLNRAWIPACFIKRITHKDIIDGIDTTSS